ncbi:hypothetical protein BCR34DRAFT_473927 [Clohesyomyces aquaticus]|uniref:Uncharacterized protein n=1 Tax=Clohesyomyces aquaticus TaxID=1231657 RepID=A0A1Y2A5X6_9PLEO|nr:hypothetical protein BCR34DRAFT_473927 [Clohesyomyces aquaticus]
MVISTPTTTLSANDTKILAALFDPETLPSSISQTKNKSLVDDSLPPHPKISSSELSALETQQNALIQKVTSQPTSPPSTIQGVMEEMDEIAEKWPEYPSVFLNRAMVRRLGLESALTSTSTPTSPSTSPNIFLSLSNAPSAPVTPLFTDLSLAISLCTPSSPSSPVSTYASRILRQAYSHRAYLYLKAADSAASPSASSGLGFRGKTKTELEELASLDFGHAARYGDEVARDMSVRTNPYAKMCGGIVREALGREWEGAR